MVLLRRDEEGAAEATHGFAIDRLSSEMLTVRVMTQLPGNGLFDTRHRRQPAQRAIVDHARWLGRRLRSSQLVNIERMSCLRRVAGVRWVHVGSGHLRHVSPG